MAVDIHSHGRGGADFCDAMDAAGQIADLILVDESLSPRMTIVVGEVMRS